VMGGGLGIQMIKDRIIKEIKKGSIAFLIFYPLLMSYIYFSTTNSDEYLAAVKYLSENQRIATEIGKIEDISLSLFGIKIRKTDNDSGQAKFVLKVSGTKAKAKYRFFLLKVNGIWQEANLLN